MRVKVGTRQQLEEKGCLTAKAGTQPICVLLFRDRVYALDDRCPHMGFPLPRGTVESGLVPVPVPPLPGLAFVSRDTRGRPPRFPLPPLGSPGLAPWRLSTWYRRFIDSRSADAAERTLATAIAAGLPAAVLSDIMAAAATDHVFLDGGHTIDFTNKAFEAVELLGQDRAAGVLPTLVTQTAAARRHEEEGEWRHPHDLAGLVREAEERLPELLASSATRPEGLDDDEVESLSWQLLGEDPAEIVAAIDRGVAAGASPEQLARAVAYAAALRIVRFHTQNDHGDWDVVHHAFTAANALHQMLARSSSTEVLRGVYHLALRVFLDRFLNVPAARLPTWTPTEAGDAPDRGLVALQPCWDEQGRVDEAGAIAYRHVRSGADQSALVAALGAALLAEDAEFHWFQTLEAAVRQARQWPAGSEPAALILTGAARFLAAHTPTRRELAQVVRIATRLRRGEALFEESGEAVAG